MLSPSPVSLFCTILLCLPLAVIFTVPSPANTATATVTSSLSVVRVDVGRTTEHNCTHVTTQSLGQPPLPELALSPPAPLVDQEDALLLRAAGGVLSKPSKPRKVAFMFLTTTPLPTAPLWDFFFAPAPSDRFNVYVHADPENQYEPPFQGVFAGRVIPSSKPTRRNTPTLAAAARRLLAHALLDDPANAVFVLLSASCVPLHSFRFTYTQLVRPRRSFIEILGNEEEAPGRWAARGEDAMLPDVRMEDFRIGSQFFALTRKHARRVVRDRRVWARFGLPCVVTWSCYPEENYFPTLLNMVDPQGCVPATLTHVDWRGRTDGHPHTYEPEEVTPELIERLRRERPRYGDELTNGSDSSGEEIESLRRRMQRGRRRLHRFLFARKFGADAVQPLMSMADDVILRD